MSIEQLADRILTEMRNGTTYIDHSNDCEDFSRPEFAFSVEGETLDYFFNSEHGYRGAYYRCPNYGISVNRCILDRLCDKVVEQFDEKETDWVRSSLKHEYAKIWIESEGKLVKPSKNDDIQLNVERWTRIAFLNTCCCENIDRARRGIQAPVGTVLNIYGAWCRRDQLTFT